MRKVFKFEIETNENRIISLISSVVVIPSDEVNKDIAAAIQIVVNGKVECDILGKLFAIFELNRGELNTKLNFRNN